MPTARVSLLAQHEHQSESEPVCIQAGGRSNETPAERNRKHQFLMMLLT